ncbi:PREDICTED: uncharacterized protein LOC105361915 isoform X2 [Ceratosolen solmsi marchali]|uniref:Uncharacterized protein LOC105361915 isoform X2 n=1 Tax=Ceratosolen solmsi marchali TaxID=326594 RepID=A0AAJ6YGA5_9HYME|nr:PREDICTED: uncharacterized protein LOC105361915 isoform X2 [Ceratosolen solmsi marchali]
MSRSLLLVLVVLCAQSLASKVSSKELTDQPPCLDDNKFYRNPKMQPHVLWSPGECAKYYLCLDDEVFEFKCSNGLLFDVIRQICDFKANVDNCDIIIEAEPSKPLLENGNCKEGSLACSDGNCLSSHYFCDGNADCSDSSDEAWCDSQNDVNAALPCDKNQCQLPQCWCSTDGTEIPGNLSSPVIPQMIMVTFEDAINSENFELFTKLFNEERKNPNGCPIRATFFVSHEHTNYRDVQHLWNLGHEIAIHSVTHREPQDWWMQNATIEDWFDEMVGEANIINRFAGIRMQDIKGMRVPFLGIGWNRQFLMMSEFGFVYDSSIIAPVSNPPIWPYTLDYKAPHGCTATGQMCPTRSYQGVWEIPINPLLVSKFIDDVLRLTDVYLISNQDVLEWMRNPTSLDTLRSFKPWHCFNKKLDSHEIACDLPNTCKLPSKILKTHRYLETCFDCPKQYPWLRNEFGHD